MAIPTAPVVAAGLIGGYATARFTKKRPLGGAVLAAAGIVAARSWARTTNPATTAILLATYLGGFGASHPLAKKIGAWPSVLTVTGVSSGAAWLLADRSAPSATGGQG